MNYITLALLRLQISYSDPANGPAPWHEPVADGVTPGERKGMVVTQEEY